MGLFDKMKDLAEERADKVDDAVDKAADVVDEKTGGKHTDKIEKVKGFVEDKLVGDEGQEPPSRLSP